MSEYEKQKEKTRNRIKEMFIELCTSQGYYHVTLKMLCEKAGIYRSTFYRYFDNLDDLLRAIENELLDEFKACYQLIGQPERADQNGNSLAAFKILTDIFYRNRKMLLFLLSPEGDQYFIYHYKKWIREILKGEVIKENITLNDRHGQIFAFILGGMMESLVYVLEKGSPFNDEEILTIANLTTLLPQLFLTEPVLNSTQNRFSK